MRESNEIIENLTQLAAVIKIAYMFIKTWYPCLSHPPYYKFKNNSFI